MLKLFVLDGYDVRAWYFVLSVSGHLNHSQLLARKQDLISGFMGFPVAFLEFLPFYDKMIIKFQSQSPTFLSSQIFLYMYGSHLELV